MMDILRRYARDRVGLFFGIVLLGFYIVAVTAAGSHPQDPFETNLKRRASTSIRRPLAWYRSIRARYPIPRHSRHTGDRQDHDDFTCSRCSSECRSAWLQAISAGSPMQW